MGNPLLVAATGYGVASAELASRPVTVGRSGDLRLEDDSIEKKHARFTLKDGKIFVAPMGKSPVYVRKETAASGPTEIAPGDVALLSTFAVVLVAETPEQELSKQARELLAWLKAYGRDRLLVQLLATPSPRLTAFAFEALRGAGPLRLQAVAPLLRSVLEAPARPSGGLSKEQIAVLEAYLVTDGPKPAVFVEQEAAARRLAAAAEAPPLPPLDEEADPEAAGDAEGQAAPPGMRAPTRAWHLLPSEKDVGHGFAHGAPPIEPSWWPRSPRDGVPMSHLATMRVPAEYRVAGPDKVALAIFQADDHTRRHVEGAPRHEGEATLLEDEIGGSYAILWLDAEVFARGPGERAPEGVHPEAPRFLELRARVGDPNVGKVIPDWDDDPGDYVTPGSEQGKAMHLDRFELPTSRVLAHFGGTSVACDNFAGGLGPFYLALEHRFGGANFGGGNAVLDLARSRIAFGS